jgi:hypothetical protein
MTRFTAPRPRPRLAIPVVLLCLASAASAAWQDYPGNIDLGGWSIVRSQSNPSEVVLLDPPAGTVIVGSPDEPLTEYLFSPDFIFAKTQAGSTGKYYVIQRDWGPGRHTGDQIIVKRSGPLTRAQLEANPAWNDEITGMTWNHPRARNPSIFWSRPGTSILYAIVALGPVILLFLTPIVAIALVIVWLRRRRRSDG